MKKVIGVLFFLVACGGAAPPQVPPEVPGESNDERCERLVQGVCGFVDNCSDELKKSKYAFFSSELCLQLLPGKVNCKRVSKEDRMNQEACVGLIRDMLDAPDGCAKVISAITSIADNDGKDAPPSCAAIKINK